MCSNPLLALRNVTAGYGELTAIRDLTLNVLPGELVALVGPNGAGKSATLFAIAGVTQVSAGTIIFDGREITRAPVAYRARLGLSLVPEGRRLFPALTVRENLEIAASALRRPRSARLAVVLELFPDLVPLLGRPVGSLSGGEQQMCALGRGLMADPKLLLIDELSLGLAPIVVKRLMRALVGIHRDLGTTVLFVEQDVDLALSVAGRVVVLSRGRKVLDTTPEQTLGRRRELEDAFLGLA